MAVRELTHSLYPKEIDCGEPITVCLSFLADAGLRDQAADMVLVMDRSGSMTGDRMAKAQRGARCLIDLLAKASGDDSGKTILGGSRLGLISFSKDARVEVPLETRTEVLTAAVDSLKDHGDTNHEKAFRKAGELLMPSQAKRKILILFTDGVSSCGDPDPAAADLRRHGVEIYCIGLLPRECLLWDWASCPKQAHVAVTEDPNQLQQMFESIGRKVAGAAGSGGTVFYRLSRNFRILRMGTPTAGFVESEAGGFTWHTGTIRESGKVSLSFEILHIGRQEGCLEISRQAFYEGCEGVQPFPPACVQVSCCCAVVTEPCPEPAYVTVEACQNVGCCPVPDPGLDGLGRIVEVSTVIHNVCPGKRVAVAVMLTEKDPEGREYKRGTKTLLIPAQEGEGCRDVHLQCIRFAVPEALAPWCCQQSICHDRHFQVKIFAHYVDSDYTCCDGECTLE